jgi:hypothetical protein
MISFATAALFIPGPALSQPPGTFPDKIDSSVVLTIRSALEVSQVGEILVSGYLALDGTACRNVPEVEVGHCSGAFLWEQVIPDPYFGGSRLSLSADDIVKRLGSALGIRDWGVPVVAEGAIVTGWCPTNEVCVGTLELHSIKWRGEPVPSEFAGDPLTVLPSVAVAQTGFVIPPEWTASDLGGRWLIESPSQEVSMALTQRPRRVLMDSSSVWDAYPDALAISYAYGPGIVVWRFELGMTTATRRTVVGYDDGRATYELTLDWSDAGKWAGAGQFALTRIVNAMTASEDGKDQ